MVVTKEKMTKTIDIQHDSAVIAHTLPAHWTWLPCQIACPACPRYYFGEHLLAKIKGCVYSTFIETTIMQISSVICVYSDRLARPAQAPTNKIDLISSFHRCNSLSFLTARSTSRVRKFA
jgi:hypothetical protein